MSNYEDKKVNLEDLKIYVRQFCRERDWDQFHGPKDLAIGAVTESSELLELFRFMTPDQEEEMLQNPKTRIEIADELADILFFLLRFADRFDFNLSHSFYEKMKKNSLRYSVKEFSGKNHKAT